MCTALIDWCVSLFAVGRSTRSQSHLDKRLMTSSLPAAAAVTTRIGTLAPVRVAVVERFTMIAEGLARVIARLPGISCVGFAVSPPMAARLVAATRPDVVVSGVAFDDCLVGADLIPLLLSVGVQPLPIIFLSEDRATANANEPGWVQVMISHSATPGELREAILAIVAEGGADADTASPTKREIQIMDLVSKGMSDAEIGAALGISARTVETHIGRLFARCASHSRAQLIRTADRHGWLDPNLSTPYGAAVSRHDVTVSHEPGGWRSAQRLRRSGT